tara:strand:- start:1185 stop:2498 length:1314 start_codon:yes stop_codon:yes gene_type:complete
MRTQPCVNESRFSENCLDRIETNDIRYYGSYTSVEFESGKISQFPHNIGLAEYPNGDKFIGYWDKGNISGAGILFLSESKTIYVSDKLSSKNFEALGGLNLSLLGNCSMGIGEDDNYKYVTLKKILFYGNCDKEPKIGTIIFDDIGEWYGEVKDFFTISNYGTMNYYDGSKYKGEWKDNKRHGQGTYTKYTKENILILSQIGIWENDKFINSTEKSTSLIKTRYGDFILIGDIENSKLNGKGKLIHKKGTKNEKIISGEWNNGAITYGTIQTPKYTYTGNIKSKKELWEIYASGNGTMRFKSGRIARGEFSYNRIENGLMEYPNGDKYEGPFTRGLRDGHGVYTQKDGTVIKDFWCTGKTKKALRNDVGKLVAESYACYIKIPSASIYRTQADAYYRDQQDYVAIEKKSCSTLYRLKKASNKLLTVCAERNSDPYNN